MEKKTEEEIWKLPLNQLILYLKRESIENLEILIKDKKTILNQPSHIFNIIFFNIPSTIKIAMFQDFEYLQKITKIPKNKLGRSFFALLEVQEQIQFLKQKRYLDCDLLIRCIKEINEKDLDLFTKEISFTQEENDFLLEHLKAKYQIDSTLSKDIAGQIQQGNRNIFYYYQTNNQDELFLYHKFNLLIKTKEYENDDKIICFHNHCLVDKSYLKKLSAKHLKTILKELQQKSTDPINNANLFIAGLRLYEIFGFDNAMKIIHDKFSFMTKSALKKFSELEYIDTRRQFRLENQTQFYSYEMLQKTKQALINKNLHYFTNICKNIDPEYLKQFYYYIQSEIKKDPEHEEEIIENILQKEIKEREAIYKEKYIKKRMMSPLIKREPIRYSELFKLLKNASVTPKLNEKGKVIVNEELTKFLLGNEKQDNDCLFRLALNRKTFGLDQGLEVLINSFPMIKKIADRKSNSLSLYSILDVIDICKSIVYKLAPNEQDLTLEAITKILNNHQFCTEPKDVILKRAKKLHNDRKKKYQASIPTVSGTTQTGISYKVLEFDSEKLITSGIDTGNCLRVGGKGEDFLKYCMTNDHAVIVGLWDQEGKFYICPFIRNGNGIYGNGLDPKPASNKINQELMDALMKCTEEICKASSEDEKIEYATITDLNQEEYLRNKNLKSIKIQEYLPIGSVFYSDYHKDDKNTYIIYQNPLFQNPNFYIPKQRYKQKRYSDYIYDSKLEKDKERIELLINSIRYEKLILSYPSNSSKDCKMKREFQPLEIKNLNYIIGNKDWFIAIDKWNGIVSECLPYDPRAAIEYQNAFASLEKKYNVHLERMRLY